MSAVFTAAARQFRPWKNGGGETAEIVVSPPGAGFDGFDWRVSTARVAQDGPFSGFPGVDRVLAVIEGGALILSVAGARHVVDAAGPALAFPGDVPCHGELAGAPVLDLNVMVRRPLRASVQRGPLAPPPPAPGRVRLALLLAAAAGLDRLDLVDLDRCGADLAAALPGVPALCAVIKAQAPGSDAGSDAGSESGSAAGPAG